MYHYYFFDLDGTLTNPGIGITGGVIHALKHFDIEISDRTELYSYIGPPLLESFQRFHGLTEEQAREAMIYYREYYSGKGMFENEVYQGIPELLSTLKKQGKKLAVATSKPEEFSVKILKHFDLIQYFDFVGAATMDEKRVLKKDVILHTMKNLSITNPSEVLMIGDREHDVIGAKACNMDCVGVLYGYGSREELENAGAMAVIKRPLDLLKEEWKLNP